MNTKDFNNCRQLFSKEEIEQLCSLYLEGKLDVEEEQVLAKILVKSSYTGEIVKETLFLMGITASQSHMIKKNGYFRKKPGATKSNIGWSLFNMLKTCVAAVCIIFSVSMIWNYFNPSRIYEEPVYEVYVNGEKISDPEQCKLMALKSYEKSQRFIAEMNAIQNKKLVDFEKKKLDADSKYKEMQSYLNEIN